LDRIESKEDPGFTDITFSPPLTEIFTSPCGTNALRAETSPKASNNITTENTIIAAAIEMTNNIGFIF
jgi:hypothetical protein